MRSTARAASIALAAALFVAACGETENGSGDSGSSEPAITVVDTAPENAPESTAPDSTVADTAPTSAPDEAGQDVEADTAAAEAATLTVGDLPDGWTETQRPDATAAARSELDARLAECVGVDGDAITAADATAASALFVAPDGTLSFVQHIGVLATERDARTVVALTAEPAVPVCVGEAYGELAADLLTAALAEGATVGAPTGTRLQVGSAGDATQAVRVVVPVTGDPSVAEVTIDHVLVRTGRAVSSLTLENRAGATPIETIDEITALVAARAGA